MRADERFLIHRWADGCAVFDQASGNTYALDSVSCAGFDAAQNNESANAAIEGAIRRQWPEKEGEAVAALVQGCLERLEACGLLQPGMAN
ncbi:MAG: HPr-rel-A system PqqD family peptide chaperone [Betaproteobacteria bacterium]|nr:HPr-rel-A system PqqD family peptide chaperone [Betaproteobacteria bacterium]